MTKSRKFIGNYYTKKPRARIDMIFNHFDEFPNIMSGYKNGLKAYIAGILESDRLAEKGELGVRVESGVISNPTAVIAIEDIMISEAIDKVDLSNLKFKDKRDAEEIYNGILELQLMKKEYGIFIMNLKGLSPKEREFLLPILQGEKTREEIASEAAINLDSLYKRIYRAKKTISDRMEMFMLEYTDEMVRIGR